MLVLRKCEGIADRWVKATGALIARIDLMRRSDVQKMVDLLKPKQRNAIFKGNQPLQRTNHAKSRQNTAYPYRDKNFLIHEARQLNSVWHV
jgi:hypothetical protein